MTATTSARRIDILVDAPLVPRVAEALSGAGVGGYTVLPALSGSGRTGRWHEERVTTAESKVLVMAIAQAAAADAFVDAVAPLLDSHRMIVTIAVVDVVRPGRFD